MNSFTDEFLDWVTFPESPELTTLTIKLDPHRGDVGDNGALFPSAQLQFGIQENKAKPWMPIPGHFPLGYQLLQRWVLKDWLSLSLRLHMGWL